MHPRLVPAVRFFVGLTRPSPQRNLQRLRERGETLAALTVRDATPEDIPALVQLHVDTWNATYPYVRQKPSIAIRQRQWRERFGAMDGTWFCLLVTKCDGGLVGFVHGRAKSDPDFAGELSKIYLRHDYQRLGLGRVLVGHAARRFLAQGIASAIVFTDPPNPSGAFFEALGAERLVDGAGVFRGGYGWRDLKAVASSCPID